MSTHARVAGAPKDDIDDMLGHTGQQNSSTAWYLHAGPEHCRTARDFTDSFLRRVSDKCVISLLPPQKPSFRAASVPLPCQEPFELKVISGGLSDK